MSRKFCGTVTCDECPFLKSVPVGHFPPERFESLAGTSLGEDGWKPIFACHKSTEGSDVACVGYVLSDGGHTNFAVRIAAIQGRFDPGALRSTGPMYESYEAMALANGADVRGVNPESTCEEPNDGT